MTYIDSTGLTKDVTYDATDNLIKAKLVLETSEDGLKKIYSCAAKKMPAEMLLYLCNHTYLLDDYTDDVLRMLADSSYLPDVVYGMLEKYGDDFYRVYRRYGDDAMEVLSKHGDELFGLPESYRHEAIDLVMSYGDEVLEGIRKYGDDFMIRYANEGETFIQEYLEKGDEVFENATKPDAGSGSEGGGKLRNGYEFGKLSVDSEEIQQKAKLAAGDKLEAVNKLDSSSFRNITDVDSFLASMPENSTRSPWESSDTIAEGVDRFVWTDEFGNKWFAECHGPDLGEKAGNNAKTGWVYRIQVKIAGRGRPFYMATDGKFYSEKLFNPNGEYYVESMANDTHIPIFGGN